MRPADGALTAYKLLAANSPHTTGTSFDVAEEALYEELGPGNEILNGFDDRVVSSDASVAIIGTNGVFAIRRGSDNHTSVILANRTTGAGRIRADQGVNKEPGILSIEANDFFSQIEASPALSTTWTYRLQQQGGTAGQLPIVSSSNGVTSVMDWTDADSLLSDAGGATVTYVDAADDANTLAINTVSSDLASHIADYDVHEHDYVSLTDNDSITGNKTFNDLVVIKENNSNGNASLILDAASTRANVLSFRENNATIGYILKTPGLMQLRHNSNSGGANTNISLSDSLISFDKTVRGVSTIASNVGETLTSKDYVDANDMANAAAATQVATDLADYETSNDAALSVINTNVAANATDIAAVQTTLSNLEHDQLGGLGDDDHPQYHNDARGDARYVNLIGDESIDGNKTFNEILGLSRSWNTALKGELQVTTAYLESKWVNQTGGSDSWIRIQDDEIRVNKVVEGVYPTADQHLVTKNYADLHLKLTGGVVSGDLEVGGSFGVNTPVGVDPAFGFGQAGTEKAIFSYNETDDAINIQLRDPGVTVNGIAVKADYTESEKPFRSTEAVTAASHPDTLVKKEYVDSLPDWRVVENTGRFYARTNNRWVGDCSSTYGPFYYQWLQNGNAGALPAYSWANIGSRIFAGEKVTRFVLAGRSNNAEVTAWQLNLVYIRPDSAARWSGGWDANAEMVIEQLYNDDLYNPVVEQAFTGNITSVVHQRTIDLDFEAPEDGYLCTWMKPSGTITADRFFYASRAWTIQTVGGLL